MIQPLGARINDSESIRQPRAACQTSGPCSYPSQICMIWLAWTCIKFKSLTQIFCSFNTCSLAWERLFHRLPSPPTTPVFQCTCRYSEGGASLHSSVSFDCAEWNEWLSLLAARLITRHQWEFIIAYQWVQKSVGWKSHSIYLQCRS
jgi:hypothetical protein